MRRHPEIQSQYFQGRPLSNLDGIEVVAEVSTRREGAQFWLLGQKPGQIAVPGSGGR